MFLINDDQRLKDELVLMNEINLNYVVVNINNNVHNITINIMSSVIGPAILIN